MNYIVIKSRVMAEFEFRVCTHLAEGWTLVGGVSVVMAQGTTVYHQAMTMK
jgi:hypothetical protein